MDQAESNPIPQEERLAKNTTTDDKERRNTNQVSQASLIKEKSSKIATLVKSSISAFVIATKTVFSKDRDEQCTIRGCRCFIWTISILLVTAAVWLIVLWVDNLQYDYQTKYWISEISPPWPLFNNVHIFAICWAIPLLCASWLICSTLFLQMTLSRSYYVMTSWLLLVPASYFVYFIVYLGSLNEAELETVMKRHQTDYKPNIDAEKWNDLQNSLKCCGIKEHGWREFVSILALDGTVPISCCKNKKNKCQKKPSEANTWSDGCLEKLLAAYQKFTKLSVFALCFTLLVMMFSICTATKYFAFLFNSSRRQEDHPKYDFRFCQYLQDCVCPYFCCCSENRGIKIVPQKSEYRTTELAFSHYVENFGFPTTHKMEMEGQINLLSNEPSENV